MIYDAHNQASYKLCMRKIIENKKDLDNGRRDMRKFIENRKDAIASQKTNLD